MRLVIVEETEDKMSLRADIYSGFLIIIFIIAVIIAATVP